MRRLSVGLPEAVEPRVAVVGTVGVLTTEAAFGFGGEAAFVGGIALATDCRIRSRRPLSLSESESDSAANRRRCLL